MVAGKIISWIFSLFAHGVMNSSIALYFDYFSRVTRRTYASLLMQLSRAFLWSYPSHIMPKTLTLSVIIYMMSVPSFYYAVKPNKGHHFQNNRKYFLKKHRMFFTKVLQFLEIYIFFLNEKTSISYLNPCQFKLCTWSFFYLQHTTICAESYLPVILSSVKRISLCIIPIFSLFFPFCKFCSQLLRSSLFWSFRKWQKSHTWHSSYKHLVFSFHWLECYAWEVNAGLLCSLYMARDCVSYLHKELQKQSSIINTGWIGIKTPWIQME